MLDFDQSNQSLDHFSFSNSIIALKSTLEFFSAIGGHGGHNLGLIVV